MPPSIVPTTGVVQIADRTTNVHDIHYIRKITDFAPLNKKQRAMITLHLAEAKRGGVAQAKEIKWPVRPFDQRNGAIIDVFNGPGLTNATGAGTAAGTIVNIAVTASLAKRYQEGDGIVLTNTTSSAYTRLGLRVTGRVIATDTTSYISAKTDLVDSSDVLAATTPRINPKAPAFPEVGLPPESRFNDVTFYSNYVQLLRQTVKCGVDELKEKSRIDPNAWTLMSNDALLEMMINRDQNIIWGHKQAIAANEYETGGLNYWINPTYGDTVANYNKVNYKTDSTHLTNTSASWLQGWYEFFRSIGEYGSRWAGDGDWNCYGGGVGIEAIINGCADRTIRVYNEKDTFGFNYRKIEMLNGNFNLYQHPLYANEPAYQRMLVCMRPEYVNTWTYGDLEYTPPDAYETKRTRYQTAFWELQEGYQFTVPDCQFIIDGLGVDR